MNTPAFPCEAKGDRTVPPEHDYLQVGIYASNFPGMMLRDYFAARALPLCYDSYETTAEIAKAAYYMADAMIAERAK